MNDGWTSFPPQQLSPRPGINISCTGASASTEPCGVRSTVSGPQWERTHEARGQTRTFENVPTIVGPSETPTDSTSKNPCGAQRDATSCNECFGDFSPLGRTPQKRCPEEWKGHASHSSIFGRDVCVIISERHTDLEEIFGVCSYSSRFLIPVYIHGLLGPQGGSQNTLKPQWISFV